MATVNSLGTTSPAALEVRARSTAGLALLLLGSGAAALIYQVLWLRLLALVFGVTVYAATTVLASFMAGLALGSAIAGRIADRARSPLRCFGLVEIGIGVLALLTQPALTAATPLYVALQAVIPDTLVVHVTVRFLGSFLVLLAPATLIGMTLPFMLKAAVGPAASVGQRIAVLYATNTAGAVLGVLLAGFHLVGSIGVAGSLRLAAVTNIVTGIAALVWSAAAPDRTPAAPSVPASARQTALPRIALAVFAISGFAALALEVVWFRVLVYFVPATTYAFSTMLAAVLAGLALGSYAATPLSSRPDQLLPRLASLHGVTALCVPLGAIGMAATYRAGWQPLSDVHVSLLLVFPAAVLMGMSFPLGLRIWAADPISGHAIDATKAGYLSSANLLGAIAGAVTGGFVVLPLLGSRVALAGLGAVYMVPFVLLGTHAFQRRWRVSLLLGVPVVFLLAAWNIPDMLAAVHSRRYGLSERLFWRDEGAQTTAAVTVGPLGGLVLYLDGLHQASDQPHIVKLHRLIGHLPMALHPDPKRAIVVGLGGGVTPGAVSQHGGEVDLVELSASVVGAAALFKHVNYDVLNNPDVRLRVDDARNFLLSRAGQYDVLTADLIQPEHAGAGNLYSREYFTLIRGAMAERALALQWIGHRSDVEYRLILRTFLDVFPETTLWADGQLLVGAVEPLVISRDAFERKLLRRQTRTALHEIGIDGFDDLLALYVAGPAELRAFVGDGALLTDDRPLVEYFRSLPASGRHPVGLSAVKGDVTRHVR